MADSRAEARHIPDGLRTLLQDSDDVLKLVSGRSIFSIKYVQY